MEITFGLYILVAILVAVAYYHGHKTGIRKGADTMYGHLYDNGVRKDDKVIVHLEYEDRSSVKEF
tara:strand:- start:2070 stop:2264 length:195 start_codon:yes stop_codon:yes gene_type:complete